MIDLTEVLDLERYPLDQLESVAGRALVERCRRELASDGMFNLDGLVRAPVLERAVAQVTPVLARDAFTHSRRHNIYFKRQVEGLAPGHPALTEFDTVNHTICADQIVGSLIVAIYEYPPLAVFLAEVMGRPTLYPMADPLARVNVMRYGAGEALNWHFDRSEFTTTLLLQAPESGGGFQFARDLRSESNPNYEGVIRLLAGEEPIEEVAVVPGTLNIFKGKNTAHRVATVEGATDRIIAVFSYYDEPGVMFSDDERIGFYGRAG